MRGDRNGTAPAPAGERIGLIAGNGRFPIIFAENATRLGYHVSAVAHIGETAPELERYVDRIHWVKVGQLNKLIKALKEDGVRQAVTVPGAGRKLRPGSSPLMRNSNEWPRSFGSP